MNDSTPSVITSVKVLPVLPLRDAVLYPNVVAPILLGEERSIKLVQDIVGGNRLVAMVAQRSNERQPPQPDDLYRVGTMGMIHEIMRIQDKAVRIVVQGVERVRLIDFVLTEPYLVARIELIADVEEPGIELEALMRTASELFVQLIGMAAELPDGLVAAVQSLSEPRHLAYLIASSMPLTTAIRQEILECDPVSAKLRRVIELLQHEISVRELMSKITAETTAEMSKAQREHILRKHMEAIQRELGEAESEQMEVLGLRDRLTAMALPEEARKEAERELERLTRTPAVSPEHGLIRTYLDRILKLPWGKLTGGAIDVARARAVLDEDHHDLDKVKERIVEYLAVKRLRDEREARHELPILARAAHRALVSERAAEEAFVETEGAPAIAEAPAPYDESIRREPILCFVGPPGVGKTSLGQSIARAMGRRFARISLGGIQDEAEIRGHRRTYIGAMPGRILQTLSRAEAADPVFMLDEVDKLSVGFHGDPSAALLEVLDPAQNHAFVDTYLGVPFDLSRVLFICTANQTETIPPALLDRMEVLTLPGYTETEKLQIARRYILPKALAAHGLRSGEVAIEDDAILRIIREYTREAGVRNLDRQLAAILRKVALWSAMTSR